MSGLKSFRDELCNNAAEIGLSTDEFKPLDDSVAEQLGISVKNVFGNSINFLWWHPQNRCELPAISHHCLDGQGWSLISQLAPSENVAVWFITENWNRGKALFYAFESTPVTVQRVLGNSHGFEYLVVSQQMDWLFAEDHHDCIIAVGEVVVSRLQAIIANDENRETTNS